MERKEETRRKGGKNNRKQRCK